MYDDVEGQTGSYKGEYLVINTKDPARFEKLYADASLRMMQKAEPVFEELANNLVNGHNSKLKDEIEMIEQEGEATEVSQMV